MAVLICRRSTTVPVGIVVERSCGRCDSPVWVSHTLVHLVDGGEYEPLCLECYPTVVAGVPSVSAMVHPDQVAELRQLGILRYAEKFIEGVNQSEQARRN